jgi:hypothetical protein
MALVIILVVSPYICFSKEKISNGGFRNRSEIENMIQKETVKYRAVSDKQLAAELRKRHIPKDGELLKIAQLCSLIKVSSDRHLDIKGTLKNLLVPLEKIKKENQFIRDYYDPRLSIYRYAKIGLLELEIYEHKGKTIEQKTAYILRKLDIGESWAEDEVVYLQNLGPEVAPIMIQVLKGKNDNVKPYVLSVLEKYNTDEVLKEVSSFTRSEFEKPKYGSYLYGINYLLLYGNKNVMGILISKLKYSDPEIRINAIDGFSILYDRGLLIDVEINHYIAPLTKDKDIKVKNAAVSLINYFQKTS